MTGQAHWISLLLVALGGIGIAILLWHASRQERTFRLEERILFCPLRRRYVRATLVKDVISLEILGVRRCTGSPDPETVTCGKPCIAQETHAPGGAPPAQPSERSAPGA